VQDGGGRRLELLTIDAGGRVSEPRWLTGADRHAGDRRVLAFLWHLAEAGAA
jgi:hypothetical protein